MGLLDALGYGSQGGYGGLLDALMHKSPLLQPEEVPAQPQYDALGNSFGQASIPQTAPDPFGPVPGLAQWATQFAPKSAQPFNVGAAPTAFIGQPQNGTPPQAPITQPPQNGTPPQVNDINVGGYQMPRMGGVAEYTPSAPSTDISAQSRAPQAAPQPPPSAMAAPQGGFSGAFQGMAANAHNGPLGMLFGGIGGGMGMESQEKQSARAQYEALVKEGLSPQKAFLAVSNPQALTALEKKQYGFQKLDNDTLLRTDPHTGKAEVAYGGEEKQTSIAGPDGKPIEIPKGLDAASRKIFMNEIARINADAAAGKKTGEQATAEIFANKMELSNKTLDVHANQGTSLAGKIASGLPMGNYVQSPEYQKYKQASSNFITALLRKESGAAIGKEEFTRYDKEYMPQPGDGPEVLAQKTEARRVAIESMKKGAGPGYKSPTGGSTGLPSGWSVQVR